MRKQVTQSYISDKEELERVQSLGHKTWPGDLPHLSDGYEWDLEHKGAGRRLMRLVYADEGIKVLERVHLVTDFPRMEVEDD